MTRTHWAGVAVTVAALFVIVLAAVVVEVSRPSDDVVCTAGRVSC